MNADKIRTFIGLAGQELPEKFIAGDESKRKLGAQLLLSEVLEYVIKGLGVVPSVNGTPITEPDQLQYSIAKQPNPIEMLDGLADVAYTMYWNSESFGVPLETAFERVCDNNLEKFVLLERNTKQNEINEGGLQESEWHCGKNVSWPKEVTKVEVIKIENQFFAVGKDVNGKVRKPSTYSPVELEDLLG